MSPLFRRKLRTLLHNLSLSLLTAAAAGLAPRALGAGYDVVIYGGTSAGVTAAVQAARMGRSVVLIEPGAHLGGMTSAGLGFSDIGDPATVGGLAREFYRAVARRYQLEPTVQLTADDAQAEADGFLWHFEPHVAEEIFDGWVHDAGVVILRNERLARPAGAMRRQGAISGLRLASGRVVAGRVFIDATYEGDLLAAAGVSYRVGREAAAEFDEPLNGVHPDDPGDAAVDPYIIPGQPWSGLLPGVDAAPPGAPGAADRRVQLFNLRLCLTDDPANRLPWRQPADYDPSRYELLARYIARHPQANYAHDLLKFEPLPNRKVDVNTNGLFSTDMPGLASSAWPEASDAERAGLYRQYLSYTQGLMWFLATDPRVPAQIRADAQQWGPAADEFRDNDNWPARVYVREARRLAGEYVMTEHNCEGDAAAPDPVALGSYGMDSHYVSLHADANGALQTEGFFFGGVSPYGISYHALTPRKAECRNLLVPVCLSATHVAYGSLRMEPVFLMLGQAAGAAAALAAERGLPVQDLSYPELARRLVADGQKLGEAGALAAIQPPPPLARRYGFVDP